MSPLHKAFSRLELTFEARKLGIRGLRSTSRLLTLTVLTVLQTSNTVFHLSDVSGPEPVLLVVQI